MSGETIGNAEDLALPRKYRDGNAPSPDVEGLTGSIPFQLTRRRDAPPIGDELEALAMFREAAQRLKAAELEHVAAQGAYVEALKRLSAEATK